MSRFEWENFINISFMKCFSLGLDKNIGLKFLYLPFGNHPRAWIQSEIYNVVYVLLIFLFIKINSEL